MLSDLRSTLSAKDQQVVGSSLRVKYQGGQDQTACMMNDQADPFHAGHMQLQCKG